MRRCCRRLHPHQREPAGYGTADHCSCPPGFESEIILFEAAAREIKKAGLAKLPSSDKLKAELDGLSARKTALQTELRKIQREETEYDTLRQNVDALLERPKEQEQQRQRSNDLE